jgi:putative SOS response-associated peptidase YedK
MGFMSGKRMGKAKQPYCFEVNEEELFAFAGIWDRRRDSGGHPLETCSILTTIPNAMTSAVHDRMPVILHPDNYDLWLDPGLSDVAAASEMLKPYDPRLMRCYPVSARINHVANDDAEGAFCKPMSAQAHCCHTFLLSGCPVEQHIAKLSEAISESHMGHLS